MNLFLNEFFKIKKIKYITNYNKFQHLFIIN